MPAPESDIPVFTIGYGPRSVDEVIVHLRLHRIQYLVDVRSKPYSRFKPEFSKGPLSEAIRATEMGYLFLGGALGGMPDDPELLDDDGKADHARIRETAAFRRGLERLLDAQRQGFRVCLMCSETDPSGCHRSNMVGAALVEHGIRVHHILGDGHTISHEALQAQRAPQLTLF